MLDRLRNQSHHVRMLVAGGLALVITVIIVFFWIWSSTGRFAESRQQQDTSAKPLRVLIDSFRDLFAGYATSSSVLPQENELLFDPQIPVDEILPDTGIDMGPVLDESVVPSESTDQEKLIQESGVISENSVEITNP